MGLARRPELWANLALLVLWPVAWWAPLASAGLIPWFGGRELSVLSAVEGLWEADRLLSVLVALLAVVLPYAKTCAALALLAGRLPARMKPWLGWLSRLAMADVFLVALYIVLAKGVGVGWVETGWGLWLFTACVAASIWSSRPAAA